MTAAASGVRVVLSDKHSGRHPRVVLAASAKDGDRANSTCFFLSPASIRGGFSIDLGAGYHTGRATEVGTQGFLVKREFTDWYWPILILSERERNPVCLV